MVFAKDMLNFYSGRSIFDIFFLFSFKKKVKNFRCRKCHVTGFWGMRLDISWSRIISLAMFFNCLINVYFYASREKPKVKLNFLIRFEHSKNGILFESRINFDPAQKCAFKGSCFNSWSAWMVSGLRAIHKNMFRVKSFLWYSIQKP
jgi:hypothetical protein